MISVLTIFCCICSCISRCAGEEEEEESRRQNHQLQQVAVNNPQDEFPLYWNGEAWVPIPKNY